MASLCKAINAEFARKDDDNGRVVYRGVVDPEWTVMRVPQGGYVFGLVLESAVQHQEGSRHPDPIHITAHFLRSAEVGPYEVWLKDLKAGRDFKHISAVFVQENQERIMAQLIFGKLVPDEAPLGRKPMTIEPPSPYAVIPPVPTHPSQCKTVPTLKHSLWSYRHHIDVATDPVLLEKRATSQRGMEWGDYVTLKHPTDRMKPSMFPFFADSFMSYPTQLPTLEDKRIWLPTMVMTVEFKFPIPKPTNTHCSQRTVAVYARGRFINEPSMRHDAYVEIWTAPADLGDGVSETGDAWKDHQRCLAVSTQMAVVVPATVNFKKGDESAKGKL